MDGANEQVIVTVFEYDGSGDCHRFDGAWHEDKPLARYVESLYDGGAVQWIDLSGKYETRSREHELSGAH